MSIREVGFDGACEGRAGQKRHLASKPRQSHLMKPRHSIPLPVKGFFFFGLPSAPLAQAWLFLVGHTHTQTHTTRQGNSFLPLR